MNQRAKMSYLEIAIPLACGILYFFLSTQCSLDWPDGAPDEYMRLQVPFFIYSKGYLPLGFEREIIDPTWGFSYASTAYGPSLLAALFMKATSLFSTNPQHLIVAARFTNVLSGALVVFLGIVISKKLLAPPLI